MTKQLIDKIHAEIAPYTGHGKTKVDCLRIEVILKRNGVATLYQISKDYVSLDGDSRRNSWRLIDIATGEPQPNILVIVEHFANPEDTTFRLDAYIIGDHNE